MLIFLPVTVSRNLIRVLFGSLDKNLEQTYVLFTQRIGVETLLSGSSAHQTQSGCSLMQSSQLVCARTHESVTNV